jgi:hypothetical protein
VDGNGPEFGERIRKIEILQRCAPEIPGMGQLRLTIQCFATPSQQDLVPPFAIKSALRGPQRRKGRVYC